MIEVVYAEEIVHVGEEGRERFWRECKNPERDTGRIPG